MDSDGLYEWESEMEAENAMNADGKNFKIWGTSYGVVGDLVMSLPMLTYFEKKYPGSYKYFVIEKKVAFTAPLYFNHPLIDCIRITGEWSGFSREDYVIANECNVKCTMMDWKHDENDWYNYRGQVEETAMIAGIYDLKDVLTEDELYPKLNKWFDVGYENGVSTYAKENDAEEHDFSKTIAIWPFATSAKSVIGRNPSAEWWWKLISSLLDMGFQIAIFGHPSEPPFMDIRVQRHNYLSFFQQVKLALACKMSIGTDSGNMWVMGAYSHPAIHLMTNWLHGHKQNFSALTPANKNGIEIFKEDSVDNIEHASVIDYIKEMMK